jgi:hypothetical protein
MAFTDGQIRQLKSKLDAQHVKTRKANGATLHYIEGWHAIAEANRIFGFDGWDRQTILASCVWSGRRGENYSTAYIAKVRVHVRAGDITVVREGSGSCEANGHTPGDAHELALKGAETDATKRALATFGNLFGLALYDHEQAGVRKARNGRALSVDVTDAGPWVLRSASGAPSTSFETSTGFAEALHKAMSEAQNITLLYAVWEQNVETVRAINRRLKQGGLDSAGIAPRLLAHLKACAIELANVGKGGAGNAPDEKRNGDPRRSNQNGHAKIDKSVLTISEPRRIRSKEHLRFVAQQPCLICGRSPTHAHHIRFAQSRGLGLKVSDEFTVPLCAIHHGENHSTGDEKSWWQEHKIEPLAVAERLWQESRLAGSAPIPNSPDSATLGG